MLAEWSSSEAGRQIANARLAFNVTGALLVIGFVHMAEDPVPGRACPAGGAKRWASA
jgi:Na+/phosphate symporter